MVTTSPIRLIHVGFLALLLGVSCGGTSVGKDAGPSAGSSGSTGAIGQPGAAGIGGIGSGRGGIGGINFGGMSGSIGITGRGGVGGFAGTGVIGGRGGFAGTADLGGRGGAAGTFGGRGGAGGSIGGTGGAGRGGTGGTAGTGVGGTGVGGRGGTGGTGGGGTGGSSGFGGFAGVSGRGGMSGTGGNGGSSGTGGCGTCRANVLPIAARDIVYSAARNEIYASVSGEADLYANTIVVIDPTTSSVTSTIPIGSNPGALALSEDGQTLWVGIDGAHSFRKVSLASTPPVLGPLVRLPKPTPSTYVNAGAMVSLPGAPLSLAVAMVDMYLGDLRVFDDGTPRPTGTSNNIMVSALVAGPSGVLFGLNSNSRTFVVIRLDSSGVMRTTQFTTVLRNYATNLVYSGNRVFTDGGDVINVTNLDAPTWEGGFPFQSRLALRDPQTLLMLTTSNTFPVRYDIRIIATVTGSQSGSVPVPSSVLPTLSTYFSKLVYAGGDTVAFLEYDYSNVARIAIMHDPAFGTPMGGGGGMSGTGGAGGMGGAGGTGGTGGAPNPCPGCSFVTVPAYGVRLAHDVSRKLIYLSAHALALSHPSSLVTVDTTTSAVASIVPVGNDPQPLALSDDGSVLWVGLAGDHRVRRMTPGTTPVPGMAYPLPTLLTSGEKSVPFSIAVLPGAPSSIAVAVYGALYGGRGVFILDDGALRANYVQPPEVAAFFLTNGPPGYLLGIGDANNLALFRLGTVGATYESFGGLVSSPNGLAYAGGYAYASSGEVIDMTQPEDPYPVGRFAFSYCALAVRSATRVMMLCPSQDVRGPMLRMLDTNTFTTIGTLTLPDSLQQATWADFVYLGGDAVALLPLDMPLQILRAPLIGAQP